MDATKQWFEDRFTQSRSDMIDVCNGISEGNLHGKSANRLHALHRDITDAHDAHRQMGADYKVVFGKMPSPTYDDVLVLMESVETSIVNKRQDRGYAK